MRYLSYDFWSELARFPRMIPRQRELVFVRNSDVKTFVISSRINHGFKLGWGTGGVPLFVQAQSTFNYVGKISEYHSKKGDEACN